MSTRGVIARVRGDGWQGRYRHGHSYPTRLGRTLFRAARDEYRGDIERFLKETIDDHPAGWSSYGGANDSVCYCHDPQFSTRGDHHPDEDWSVDDRDRETWCEWAYAFNPRTNRMFVYKSYTIEVPDSSDPRFATRFEIHWAYVCTVDLAGVEPDWQVVEDAGIARGGRPRGLRARSGSQLASSTSAITTADGGGKPV